MECPIKSGQKPRIVHLLRSLDPGGIEVQLLGLLPLLSAEFDFEVITLRREGRLAAAMRERGIPVTKMRTGRRSWHADALALARALSGADIVHAHSRYPVAMGLTGAFVAKVPGRIAHFYSDVAERDLSLTILQRTHEVFRRVPLLVACSSRLREGIMRRWPVASELPFEVLPSAADLVRFQPADASRKAELRASLGVPTNVRLIGIVGRIDPNKNHIYLLDAAAVLARPHPNFKLWIIGTGESESIRGLRDEIRLRNLEGRVEYRGYIEDLARVMPALDAFVLCSVREGMPVSVLEAWASGVPVAATRSPGLKELIRDGVDGLLADPGDPASMAEILGALLNKSVDPSELIRAGSNRAAEFSLDRAAEKLKKIYEKSLETPPRDSAWERIGYLLRALPR